MATVVGEPVEPPLPHVGRACAPNLDRLWHSQSKTTLLSSLCVIDSLRIVESGICEARSNPFMTDSCKICFPKKHPFHFQLLTRQQATTNDYCRLQTFNQRLGLDRHCIFAAINILNLQLWKHQNTLKASQLKKREAKNVLL